MKKQILTLIAVIASAIGAYAENIEAQNALSYTDKQFFIENKGQWPDEVLFLSQIGGLDAWITKNGVLYDFYKLEEVSDSSKNEEHTFTDKFEHKNYTRYGHRVLYKFQGNNADVTTESKEKQEGYYNYLIGNDPSKHASNVGLYKEAIVKDVYNGIDVRYYFDKGSIRHDYIVHPGADPSLINFVLEGTDNTHLNQEGNLAFSTRFGEVALAELETYQETKDNRVASRFVETENGWSIAVGDYNINETLIIDPLVYSTFLGGSNVEHGRAIVVDASGCAYVSGGTGTGSTIYPTTVGAYQVSMAGNSDVFVTKLNTTGTALVYSTFIGGSSSEDGNYLAIDAAGNAYVTGITYSSNFPTTAGAYQTSRILNGVFVTKLNSTGTALVYSTYLGDTNNGYGIAVDVSGCAYITGFTDSTGFPVTSGAYQTT